MTEDWKRERLRKTIQQEKRRGDLDYYRVQSDKRWWRRKWQAEWDGCRWAQRGYTRPGIRAMARVRRSHPAVDSMYIRCRIMIRRCVCAFKSAWSWSRRRFLYYREDE